MPQVNNMSWLLLSLFFTLLFVLLLMMFFYYKNYSKSIQFNLFNYKFFI